MFNFEGHDVRVVMIDDNPWFVADDVTRILKVYRRIKEGREELHTYGLKALLDSDDLTHSLVVGERGSRTCLCLSESGLYKLIMRSDKPAAKRFQNWVTREVLPALRKDGMYVMGEEKVKTGGQSFAGRHRRRSGCLCGSRGALGVWRCLGGSWRANTLSL